MISQKIREDFPLLKKRKDIIYLDNAATSLKPKSVIEAIDYYYNEANANIARGSHRLSEKATQMFENSRREVAKFVHADENEIVFTRNATEGINLAATSLERNGYFQRDDEIVVSLMEHHANFVPWQEMCRRNNLKFKVVNLNNNFTLDMDDLQQKITHKTKMVAITHAANTVGSITNAKEIGKIAHESGSLFLLDVAQSAPHLELNMKKINADFAPFSAHKMLGPTGIGAFYGKKELLEKMPPYNYGGGMIEEVKIEKVEFAPVPQKFEAGTAPIAQAFGFSEAVRYLKKIGIGNVHEHEKKLTQKCIGNLSQIKNVQIYCPKDVQKQTGIVLFEVKGIDAVDLAIALDESRGIAIRSGMHCAQPIVSSINPKGLDRASFYLYNTAEEVEIFTEEVEKVAKAFG